MEAWQEKDTHSNGIQHGEIYRNQRPAGPYPSSRVTFADYTREVPVHNDILSTKAARNPYLAASLRRLVQYI